MILDSVLLLGHPLHIRPNECATSWRNKVDANAHSVRSILWKKTVKSIGTLFEYIRVRIFESDISQESQHFSAATKRISVTLIKSRFSSSKAHMRLLSCAPVSAFVSVQPAPVMEKFSCYLRCKYFMKNLRNSLAPLFRYMCFLQRNCTECSQWRNSVMRRTSEKIT